MAVNPLDLELLQRLLDEGRSQVYIAETMGRSRQNIQMHINRLKRKAAADAAPLTGVVPAGFHLSSVATTVDDKGAIRSQSYRAKSGEEGDVVPDNGSFPAPDGMYVRSVSTLVDGQTGAVKQQWVKADIDREAREAAQVAALRALCEKLEPLPPTLPPEVTDSKLCNLYTLTDCHVGMLAWKRETGEPWDLPIAEAVLAGTFMRMLESSPAARVGIVNQLGDFLHFDSLKPVTPEHGHLLDADSRYQKVVEVAVRILRRIIAAALVKHEIVRVYMHEGNHDPSGSVWLRVMFAALYANEPRVIVERSPLPYVAYQHGKTMIAFHHGHMAKNDSLPLLFAARFPAMWGATTKRYIHVGHRHHVDEKEHPGIKVVQHPTLAAADAYAARGGWLSERQASAITYHDELGEYSRCVFVPELGIAA